MKIGTNELLKKLMKILKGNSVKSQQVISALDVLCENFNLENGTVYITDMVGEFYLSESYSISQTLRAPPFISSEYIYNLGDSVKSEERFFYKDSSKNNENIDIHSHFNADTVIAVPVRDDIDALYGMVILTSNKISSLNENQEQELGYLLDVLIRYLTMRMYKHKLIQAHAALENVLDNSGIDIYVNDFNTHDILYTNKSMAEPYGGKEKFLGKKCWEVLFPGQGGPCEFCPQKNLIDEAGAPTKVYSWEYQRMLDGTWFRVFSKAFRWMDGRLAHVVSSANISENKRNEALVEKLANYDQLIGLPNRRMLIKACEQRIESATELSRGYVLFFDIDGFKEINDNLGHSAGDEFLIQLGQFFKSLLLLENSIYRNGGDEFVALLNANEITNQQFSDLINTIHDRFKQPWVLKNGDITCSISIGVSKYPDDGTTAETLLHKADSAMYKAKKLGGAVMCVFSDDK